MSLETTLAALVDAINAQTEALQRNTDISEKLLIQRGGVNQATPETEEKPEPKADAKADAAADKKAKAAAERKAKAEAKKKAEAEAAAQEEAEAAAGAEDDADDDKVYTAKDVRDAAMNLRDNVGKEALEKAYKAFKVAKVKELDEENYGPFVRHCEQLANADDEDV